MSSKKNTLTATLPNGVAVNRTTNHNYKFVVCVQGKSGMWGDLQWTSRRDLAEKAVSKFRAWNNPNWAGFSVVEVNSETAKVQEFSEKLYKALGMPE